MSSRSFIPGSVTYDRVKPACPRSSIQQNTEHKVLVDAGNKDPRRCKYKCSCMYVWEQVRPSMINVGEDPGIIERTSGGVNSAPRSAAYRCGQCGAPKKGHVCTLDVSNGNGKRTHLNTNVASRNIVSTPSSVSGMTKLQMSLKSKLQDIAQFSNPMTAEEKWNFVAKYDMRPSEAIKLYNRVKVFQMKKKGLPADSTEIVGVDGLLEGGIDELVQEITQTGMTADGGLDALVYDDDVAAYLMSIPDPDVEQLGTTVMSQQAVVQGSSAPITTEEFPGVGFLNCGNAGSFLGPAKNPNPMPIPLPVEEPVEPAEEEPIQVPAEPVEEVSASVFPPAAPVVPPIPMPNMLAAEEAASGVEPLILAAEDDDDDDESVDNEMDIDAFLSSCQTCTGCGNFGGEMRSCACGKAHAHNFCRLECGACM